jgi:hypothetical protein
MKNPRNSSQFMDLASYRKIRPAQGAQYGNVIKSRSATVEGRKRIEVSPDGSNQPVVLLKKTGDIVEGIEFVCTCGRSTAVQFDYEGE